MKTHRRAAPWILGGLLVAVLARPAPAQTLLWDNGTPWLDSWAINIGDHQFASDFTLSEQTSLSQLKFWTMDENVSSVFSWAIHSSTAYGAGQGPGSILASGTTAATRSSLGPWAYYSAYTVYLNSIDLPAIDLGPGTYWLALHYGTLSERVNQFAWARTAATGEPLRGDVGYIGGLNGNFTEYTEHGWDGAYQLFGAPTSTVPEPVSLALLGTGLAGLGAVRRRRARS